MLFHADIFVSTELSVFVKFLRKTSMVALFVLYLVFRVKKSIFAIFFFFFFPETMELLCNFILSSQTICCSFNVISFFSFLFCFVMFCFVWGGISDSVVVCVVCFFFFLLASLVCKSEYLHVKCKHKSYIITFPEQTLAQFAVAFNGLNSHLNFAWWNYLWVEHSNPGRVQFCLVFGRLSAEDPNDAVCETGL